MAGINPHLPLWMASGAAPVQTPSLVDAIMAAHADQFPEDVPEGEEAQWYACLLPHGISRVVATQAEADILTIGVARATRRGFSSFEAAVRCVDRFVLENTPAEINRTALYIGDKQSEIASTVARFTGFTHKPLLGVRRAPLHAPSFTVSMTPLNFVPGLNMPQSLTALVGGCRLHVHTTGVPPNPNSLNINTSDLSLRGERPAEGAQAAVSEGFDGEIVPYGQIREVGTNVYAELSRDPDTGREVLERVIPMSRIQIADGSSIVPRLLGGMNLVRPANYVPRRPNHYYWAVLQGAAVGIFYGTASQMAGILPPDHSVGHACLTLQEATTYFYEMLDDDFVLSELCEARDALDTASTALLSNEVQVANAPAANTIYAALNSTD